MTALAGCSGPDAGRFKDWWLGEFVKLNALEPLPTYIAKWPGRADVIEDLWNTGKITEAGAAYMMPQRFITFYLYYRKDWFADAGLSAPRRRSATSWRPPRSSRTPPRTSTASAGGAAPAGRVGGWPSWWWAARASWTRRGRSSSIMPRV